MIDPLSLSFFLSMGLVTVLTTEDGWERQRKACESAPAGPSTLQAIKFPKQGGKSCAEA